MGSYVELTPNDGLSNAMDLFSELVGSLHTHGIVNCELASNLLFLVM